MRHSRRVDDAFQLELDRCSRTLVQEPHAVAERDDVDVDLVQESG